MSKAKKKAKKVIAKAVPLPAEDVAPDTVVKDAVAALAPDGRISPRQLVDAAAKLTHPLHDRFEWDNGKAGDAYRLEQARRLIRSVQVVITTEEREYSCVGYVHDPESEEQGYISVERIKRDPATAREMLSQELARAVGVMKRAEQLAEVVGLADEVRPTLKRLEKVRARVEARIASAPPA